MSRTESTSPSDSELIRQAKNGDVAAFGNLYTRYADRLYRYLRLRVDTRADAEDLCEAAFLRSFESLDRYKERGHPFSAFLFQVARNLLVDHYRTRAPTVELDSVADPPADEPDLLDSASQAEQIQAVVRALERLPEDYREVIRLRVVLEFPTPEVAAWMGRSPGAVRVLLHRALSALRNELSIEDG